MLSPVRIIAQACLYVVFAAGIGYFSFKPSYQHITPDQALIKLSFSHAGEHKEDCRRLSPEEIAKLAPNMRRPLACNRERIPLMLEIMLDKEVLYHDFLTPSGLSRDGESTIYRKFQVKSGIYTITARLRDSRREEGFDYEHTETIRLEPYQNFVIDFRIDKGGFVFL